jgi:hypothetical protein
VINLDQKVMMTGKKNSNNSFLIDDEELIRAITANE